MMSREWFLCHFVSHGVTVNAQYYASYLQNHLHGEVRRKRPAIAKCDLLRDDATPHKAICVRDLLRRWWWEVLEHPPYSLDLSPCGYDLIPKLKAPMRGHRFVHEMTLPLQFDAWLWQTSTMVTPMVFVDFHIVGSEKLTVLGITLKVCKMLMCLKNAFFINGYHY